jgi:hypothetical protein
MIIPFKAEELFEINEKSKVSSFDNDILIIDDFYTNYDDIIKVLNNIPVPVWKRSDKFPSRNFIDYYDCRPTINIPFPQTKVFKLLETISNYISFYFKDHRKFKLMSDLFEFNYYKNVKRNVSSNLQHHPHIDYDYNCIIYLDEVSSGGTAFYDELNDLQNNESVNLLHDVSLMNKKIVPSKPNRLVIFSGWRYHGGYIQNHNDYLNDWRINQILFLQNQDYSLNSYLKVNL